MSARRIIVVGENLNVSKQLSQLEGTEHHVFFARTTSHAAKVVRADAHIDLVMVNLVGQEAYEFLGALRRSKHCSWDTVILLPADDPVLADEAITVGSIVAFTPKTTDQLCAMIE